MSQLQVQDIAVPALLKKLKTEEWLTPDFQREFVWSNASVISLVNSIIDARPVGMITLWEQSDGSPLNLEPISIPDWDPQTGKTFDRPYSNEKGRPGRYYAILDGRQRSTALALAFGGLKSSDGKYRHAGAYYLDVTAKDVSERVVFVSSKDISRRKIDTLPGSISQGLFPLAVEDPDKLTAQWMGFLQHLQNKDYYPNDTYPNTDEINRRNQILSQAFAGIINTKLAVYIVPSEYSLAEICDIFETLNTTGTKVSPVDLIHSGLFNDTAKDPGGPLLLRDQIDALGELDGAVGWASSTDRPELIAQFVAATHVALDTKPAPRKMGGVKEPKITSVRSGDLLAIPASFWKQIFKQNSAFASFIGGFQNAVSGGLFSMARCPYPASAAVYVALRGYLELEPEPAIHWNIEKLNKLYCAFFWRNALASRYDQGFLTQVGTDINEMKSFLAGTDPSLTDEQWRVQANAWLDRTVGEKPELSDVEFIVSNGDEKGALRRASLLLLYARAYKDIGNPDLTISSLDSKSMDLHHIYPKQWCSDNAGGKLRSVFDKNVAGHDWVNSAANLIPMHRRTNNEWRKKAPATFLGEHAIDFDSRPEIWAHYFVTREAYEDLTRGEDGVESFLRRRARTMAEEISRRTVA